MSELDAQSFIEMDRFYVCSFSAKCTFVENWLSLKVNMSILMVYTVDIACRLSFSLLSGIRSWGINRPLFLIAKIKYTRAKLEACIFAHFEQWIEYFILKWHWIRIIFIVWFWLQNACARASSQNRWYLYCKMILWNLFFHK